MGYKYFNYSIDGNNLTVYAWLKGVAGEICLEQDGLATMNAMVMSYRNSLDVLFQEISKLNTVDSNQNITGYDSDTAQTISGNSQSTNNTDVFLDKFQDETTKKKENMCEIGFWLSIIGLLLPFFGLSFGYIVYALDFYFAAQGLKTRKKRKAIATFVISIISIVLVIINLLG